MRSRPDFLWQCPEELQSWLVGCSDLIVSPERAAWIAERYPETDTGRPILFAPTRRGDDRTDVAPLAEIEDEDGELELAMAAD
jgi:hypothetical protein